DLTYPGIDLGRVLARLELEEGVAGQGEQFREATIELREIWVRVLVRLAGEEADSQAVELVADLAEGGVLDPADESLRHGCLQHRLDELAVLRSRERCGRGIAPHIPRTQIPSKRRLEASAQQELLVAQTKLIPVDRFDDQPPRGLARVVAIAPEAPRRAEELERGFAYLLELVVAQRRSVHGEALAHVVKQDQERLATIIGMGPPEQVGRAGEPRVIGAELVELPILGAQQP